MQLSQMYTGGTETVVTDNAFHGSIDSVHVLSPKVFKGNNLSKSQGTPNTRPKFVFGSRLQSLGGIG